jgi:hypothetical protein
VPDRAGTRGPGGVASCTRRRWRRRQVMNLKIDNRDHGVSHNKKRA